MSQFPYPTFECPGEKAFASWEEMRERGKREGFYPIIVGDRGDVQILAEAIEANGADPAAILQDAVGLKGRDVLERRAQQEPELFEQVEIGEWPEAPVHQGLVTPTEMQTGEPKPRIIIAKIPAVHSYEVPAVLRFGGWNECPAAEEHVAIHRMWNQAYGAEIVAVTGDVIECRVSRPPNTEDQAMALAEQQFIYCSDIVYQGVETLSALAAGLQDHNFWFFWWD